MWIIFPAIKLHFPPPPDITGQKTYFTSSEGRRSRGREKRWWRKRRRRRRRSSPNHHLFPTSPDKPVSGGQWSGNQCLHTAKFPQVRAIGFLFSGNITLSFLLCESFCIWYVSIFSTTARSLLFCLWICLQLFWP